MPVGAAHPITALRQWDERQAHHGLREDAHGYQGIAKGGEAVLDSDQADLLLAAAEAVDIGRNGAHVFLTQTLPPGGHNAETGVGDRGAD